MNSKITVSRAGRRSIPVQKPDMIKEQGRGRKVGPVTAILPNRRRSRSSTKVSPKEPADPQEATPVSSVEASSTPTKKLRLKAPNPKKVERRSILEVADELEEVEREHSSSLKQLEEPEFKSTQIESLKAKDYSGLTKLQMEHLLYINESSLRTLGVTTFRGKNKKTYLSIFTAHHDVIKESFKSLKVVQVAKISTPEIKPLVDYSGFRFKRTQTITGKKVVLLARVNSKLHKIGEGNIQSQHPSVTEYPALIDTASDYTFVELTQLEVEF